MACPRFSLHTSAVSRAETRRAKERVKLKKKLFVCVFPRPWCASFYFLLFCSKRNVKQLGEATLCCHRKATHDKDVVRDGSVRFRRIY